MRKIYLLLFALVVSTQLLGAPSDVPVRSRLGDLEFDRGDVKLNGVNIDVPHGTMGEEIKVYLEDLNATGDATTVVGRIFLLSYISKRGVQPRTRGFVILDISGSKPIFSNPVFVDAAYSWGDNNYAVERGGIIYFGVYETDDYRINRYGAPSPKQFWYKDGELKENFGPWAGPAKPKKYIVPEKPGPCFNVANVPECIGEIERDKARKKQRRNNAP
jgi:hypothetical protein